MADRSYRQDKKNAPKTVFGAEHTNPVVLLSSGLYRRHPNFTDSVHRLEWSRRLASIEVEVTTGKESHLPRRTCNHYQSKNCGSDAGLKLSIPRTISTICKNANNSMGIKNPARHPNRPEKWTPWPCPLPAQRQSPRAISN